MWKWDKSDKSNYKNVKMLLNNLAQKPQDRNSKKGLQYTISW